MYQLSHNGVIVPRYEANGFHMRVKNQRVTLTAEQEEMALAWVKKQGTEYVEDRRFVTNFLRDFQRALNLDDALSPDDLDFSEIEAFVAAEKDRKLALTKEEKRRLAQTRKAKREANKQAYGYALVDGESVEISNYTAEPSSIFMGRGKHPLRGRWKVGPRTADITLNLSSDSPTPRGEWGARVWESDSMWVARWDDRLTGRKKYVWLADTFPLKQERDIEKFDKARELESKIRKVRGHIRRNLESSDRLRRKIATVCYLIDRLNLRVGDEKDKDEADTIGAATLRPQHVSFDADGVAHFKFLGKDSVSWHLKTRLPDPVEENLRECIARAQSAIFKGVRSDNVSAFLDEALPGLTAKVFRTYHATRAVKESLTRAAATREDPDFAKKHVAKMANLQAAITCNHKKKTPKRWRESLSKMEVRLRELKAKRKALSMKTFRKTETKVRRINKADERIHRLRLRITLKKKTKNYNLNTSLKSYIDPRGYYAWCQTVDYDWTNIYSKTLQRKFQWVETSDV
jgi:DNA topoisomerase-1